LALGSVKDLRILVALENGQAAECARGVFKQIKAPIVKVVNEKRLALDAMQEGAFNLIIIEDSFSDLGGLDFCRFIRMTSSSTSTAPLVLCMKVPDAIKVVEARNAGINKIMLMPFTTASLLKTVQDIMLFPKDFIQVSGYTGPCRRIKDKARNAPDRRQSQQGLLSIEKQQKLFKGI